MYDSFFTSIKTIRGEIGEFPITIGLHQDLALIPYLFALVVDELSILKIRSLAYAFYR